MSDWYCVLDLPTIEENINKLEKWLALFNIDFNKESIKEILSKTDPILPQRCTTVKLSRNESNKWNIFISFGYNVKVIKLESLKQLLDAFLECNQNYRAELVVQVEGTESIPRSLTPEGVALTFADTTTFSDCIMLNYAIEKPRFSI